VVARGANNGAEIAVRLSKVFQATASFRTKFVEGVAALALVCTFTHTTTSGSDLVWDEEDPSHQTRHTQGSLAQQAQEATPGLARAGCHRFGIPSDLFKHDQPQLQGTWVHRHVALDLARWLSPQFAVQVNEWVRRMNLATLCRGIAGSL
jgi:hypothetical protein